MNAEILQRAMVRIALVLALLAALLGWTTGMRTFTPTQHSFHNSVQYNQTLPHRYCPPPPIDC